MSLGGYIDVGASGGGGGASSLLASNNVWTGTNSFTGATTSIGNGVAQVVITSGASDVNYSNVAGAVSNSAHTFAQPVRATGLTSDANVSATNHVTTAFGSFYGVSGNSRLIINNGFATFSNFLQLTAGRSRVNGDLTNVTITPANITGLSATVVAGRFYTGEIVLYCSEATAADGLRLDFDGGTATMTSFIAQGMLSDDTSVRMIARVTALATDITETTITGSTIVTIKFAFVVNAAGTFIPRFAKEADAAGATLTLTANSYMWLEDTP